MRADRRSELLAVGPAGAIGECALEGRVRDERSRPVDGIGGSPTGDGEAEQEGDAARRREAPQQSHGTKLRLEGRVYHHSDAGG